MDKLDFGIFLNTDEFEKKVAAAKKLADDLNTSLTNALNIQNKLNGSSSNYKQQKEAIQLRELENREIAKTEKELAKVQREQQKVATEVVRTQREEEKLNQEREKGNDKLGTHKKKLLSLNRLLEQSKNLIFKLVSIDSFGKIAKELISITSEFEKQKIALSAIIRDATYAEDLFDKLKVLAVKSPFQFKELTSFTKQLSAFSFEKEELYDTVKMLADVSSGLGVDMSRIILAYGQVKSAAFLRGQEVRQFTEAGVPILNMLAKQFSEIENRIVSVGEVFDKISGREVPFEMVAKAFKEMTSEGGMFFNMQEKLADSLSGKISNLKDAYQIMFAEIGNGQSNIIGGAIDIIRGLINNYKELIAVITHLIGAYALHRLGIASNIKLQSIQRAMQIGTALGMTKLQVATGLLTRKTKALNAVLLKNPYVLVGAAIATLVSTVSQLKNATTDYQRILEKANSVELRTEIEMSQLRSLTDVLKSTTSDTKAYIDAKAALMSQYSPYIEQLKEEGKWIEDNANSYNNLEQAVQKAYNAKYAAMAKKDIEQEYADGMKIQMDNLKKMFTEMNLSSKEQGFVINWLFGDRKIQEGRIRILIKDWEKKLNGTSVFSKNGSNRITNAQSFDLILGNIRELNAARDESIALLDALIKANQKAEGELTIFQSRVRNVLIENNKGTKELAGKFWIDQSTSQEEYVTKIKELYKGLKSSLNDFGILEPERKQYFEEQLALIEKIAEAGEFSLDSKSEKNKKSKERTSLINQETQSIKDYIANYKGYKELLNYGLTEDAAKKISFGFDADRAIEIEKEISNSLAKFNITVPLDFSVGSESIFQQLKDAEVDPALLEDLKTYISELEKLRGIESSADYKMYKEWYNLADQTQQKIKQTQNLQKNRLEISEDENLDAVRKAELIKEIDYRIAKLNTELINILKKRNKFKNEILSQESQNIKDFVNNYKKYKELLGFGLTEYAAKKISFGNAGTIDLENEASKALAKFGINTKLDFSVGSESILQQLKDAGVSSTLLENLKTLIAELERLRSIESKDDYSFYKELNQLLEHTKQYEKQIADLEAKREFVSKSENYTAEAKAALLEEIEYRLAKLKEEVGEFERISLSKFWDQLFNTSIYQSFDKLFKLMDDSKKLAKAVVGGETGKAFSSNGKIQYYTLERDKVKAILGSDSPVVEQLFGDKETIIATVAEIKKLGDAWRDVIKTSNQKSAISTFFELIKNIKKENGGKMPKLSEFLEGGSENAQALLENLKQMPDEIKQVSSAISNLLGLDFDGLDKTISGFVDLIAGASSGDLAKGINGLKSIYDGIKSITNEIENWNTTYNNAISEFERGINKIKRANELSSFDVAFGSDDYNKFRQNTKDIKDYYDALKQGIENVNKTATSRTNRYYDENGIFSDQRNGIEKFLGIGWNKIVKLDLSQYNPDNIDELQAWYEAYKEGIDEKNQKLIEGLLNDWEQYQDALEGIANYMSDVFGSVADEITEKFINSFIETGNAATDLGDIVTNVAKQMAADVVKSLLIERVFTDEAAQELAGLIANKKIPEAVAKFLELLNDSEELVPLINEFLYQLLPSLKGDTANGTEDLRNNIQGITEDTANLLASYINAIRADVSSAKSQRERIIQAINGINVTYNFPNLENYLNDIRAHNASIADSNLAILREIQSVITPENGGLVKVTMNY